MAQIHSHSKPSALVRDYFSWDTVYRTDKHRRTEFGVVISSFVGDGMDDEDEDLMDHEDLSRPKRLKLRVAWYPKQNMQVVLTKKLKLYDRLFRHGSIVRRVGETTGQQRGYCTQIEQILTLQICGLNKVVENVPYSEWIPSTFLSAGRYCLYKSWIGQIYSVEHNVTLKCKDGSQLIVAMYYLQEFKDVWNQRKKSRPLESRQCYVGQQLIGPKRWLRRATWLNRTPKMNAYMASNNKLDRQICVTVMELIVNSIHVSWLHRILDNPMSINRICVNPSPIEEKKDIVQPSTSSQNKKAKVDTKTPREKAPNFVLNKEDIKLVKTFNYFQNRSLEQSKKGYFVIKSSDTIKDFRGWAAKVTDDLLYNSLKVQKDISSGEDDYDESDWQFVDSSDEVQQQNGKSVRRRGIKRKISLNTRKIGAKRLKLSKRKDPSSVEAVVRGNGLVPVQIVAAKSMVSVIWENGESEANIPSTSLYEIVDQDNLGYFPGDFVVGTAEDSVSMQEYGVVQRADHVALTATVKWFKMSNSNEEPHVPQLVKTEDVGFYDIEKHPDFTYRANTSHCVIRTISSKEVESSDITSRVGQVIDVLLENGQLLCAWADGSKTYVYPQQLQTIKHSLYGEDDDDDDFEASGSINSICGSEDIRETTSRLEQLTQLEGQLRQNGPLELSTVENIVKNPTRLVVNAISPKEATNQKLGPKSTPTRDVTQLKSSSVKLVASVPESHKFKYSIFQLNDPKGFAKHVSKEMHILRSSLPPAIVVKAYEERMDLLSVMIEGPASTPYEDGLFFFDLQLPHDYPESPPSVYYRSYCTDSLNPNLYEDGHLCLSLLGTWGGKGTELWKPRTSSLLQLLVSIQGLILVQEPYYNEAGYEDKKGEPTEHEESRLYNELVVLKLVQSMTNVVSNPNDAFVEESRQHFGTSARRFILRLEQWLYMSTNWTSVKGSAEYVAPDFPLLPGSPGFCLSLKRAVEIFKDALRRADVVRGE